MIRKVPSDIKLDMTTSAVLCCFADDMMFILECEYDLQRHIYEFQKQLKKMTLQYQLKKIKIIVSQDKHLI